MINIIVILNIIINNVLLINDKIIIINKYLTENTNIIKNHVKLEAIITLFIYISVITCKHIHSKTY